MQKDFVKEGNGRLVVVFRPAVQSNVQPVIAEEITEGGIKFYRDVNGKVHIADIYDKVWGKRDKNAILGRQKCIQRYVRR